MRPDVVALPADAPVSSLKEALRDERSPRRQKLYPVVDEDRTLIGVLPRHKLGEFIQHHDGRRLADVIGKDAVVAFPDEPLRITVFRMAETGLTRFPVVEDNRTRRLVGMISLEDLLKARTHALEAERRRERILPLRLKFPIRRKPRPAA